MRAEDMRDLSPVAELLRDPSVMLTQEDRDELAELLCPKKRGAKVRSKLIGRQGRSKTADRDEAFYDALQDCRHASGMSRMSADVKAEIAAQHGLLDFESAKKAEGRGKKLSEARWLAHHDDED